MKVGRINMTEITIPLAAQAWNFDIPFNLPPFFIFLLRQGLHLASFHADSFTVVGIDHMSAAVDSVASL